MNLVESMTVAIQAAFAGGKKILDVYDSEFDVEFKEDESPLTMADRNAHLAISEYLQQTDFPILSEEGRSIGFEERKNWDYFWMVDPLDGTKEFVKRNGEFTVNIALIKGNKPVAGVIYVPVKKTLYFSLPEGNAYKTLEIESFEELDVLLKNSEILPSSSNDSRPYRIVGSRSHMSAETTTFMEQKKEEHGDVEVVSMGSSLKLCLVADGTADIYPRYAPTMEWDTAAGHAIANAAGKEVTDFKTNAPMQYNKENLLNNWFTVE